MASEEDDLPLLNRTAQSFDRMSIDELHDYITDLRREIEKTEAVIEAKKNAQSAADNVFK